MHEMSLAEGILGIARDYAEKNGAKRVTKIALLIGEMAGVETGSLKFCLGAVTKGTLAEGAAIEIRHAPLAGRCTMCGRERPVESYNFICPDCGGILDTVSGREMRVDYLEME